MPDSNVQITLTANWGKKKRGQTVTVDAARANKMVETSVAVLGKQRLSDNGGGYADRQMRRGRRTKGA